MIPASPPPRRAEKVAKIRAVVDEGKLPCFWRDVEAGLPVELVAGGAPLLSSRTLRLMARNHLPGGPTISETQNDGMGCSVALDPAATENACSAGEPAGTGFWVDPAERLSVQLFTQPAPSCTYPLRSQLTYQALR